MRTILDGDPRKPVAGFLNYPPGVDVPSPFVPMGPNTLGEYVWPVTVAEDATRTRVGFAYYPPKLEEAS